MEKNKCQKHARTIMIGALARIEEKFGELWGHGKVDGLTKEEEYWWDIWSELRTSILDLGNDLIKDLENIKSYKYSYTFRARNSGDDNSKGKDVQGN